MPTTYLIRKLESMAPLSAAERSAILALKGTVRNLGRHEDLVRTGDRPGSVTLVTAGLLCRHKTLEDGKRQIMSFHIPGDVPDLHSLFIDQMDHNLGAVTLSQVMTIPHRRIEELLDSNRQLAKLFWRETLIDAAIFREWVVSVGGREGLSRVAHLLCEIMFRMKAVGLAQGERCALPISQEELGEATGLSAVHINRMLQELRGKKLVEIGRGALTVLDWKRLKKVAEFNPLYLHFSKKQSEYEA